MSKYVDKHSTMIVDEQMTGKMEFYQALPISACINLMIIAGKYRMLIKELKPKTDDNLRSRPIGAHEKNVLHHHHLCRLTSGVVGSHDCHPWGYL